MKEEAPRTPARPIAGNLPWQDDGFVTPPPQGPDERHPTRKWIIASVVLLVAVVGLGAYALSLRSDIDDKDAHASQHIPSTRAPAHPRTRAPEHPSTCAPAHPRT